MVDDVKQRITVEADEALRRIEDVTRRLNKLADSIDKGGKKSDEASPKTQGLGRALGSLRRQVTSLVTGYLGAQGLIALIRLSGQEMKQNAKAARDLAQATLELEFLTAGNSGAALNVVKQSAEISGRSQIEIAETFGQFVSQTAELDDPKRLALFRQLIETSLSTKTSSQSLVSLFAKGSQFVEDPQELQNMIVATLDEADTTDPAVIGKLLPQVLPVGQLAGLEPEVTAGLLAFATRRSGSSERAGTGLRNIITKLAGKGTPESREFRDALGIKGDLGVIGQLRVLAEAQQAGRLDLAGVGTIVGDETTTILGILVSDLPAAEATVGRVAAAKTGDADITRERLETVLKENPSQRLNLLAKQAESRIEGLKANDLEAQRVELGGLLVEEQLRRSGRSPFVRAGRGVVFNQLTNIGLSPKFAIRTVIEDTEAAGNLIQGLNSQPNINVNVIGQQFNVVDPSTDVKPKEDIP